MKESLDDKIIQAFLDGTLSEEMHERVLQEILENHAYVEEAREAAATEKLLAVLLTSDSFCDVPTERLWERINTTIAGNQKTLPCYASYTAYAFYERFLQRIKRGLVNLADGLSTAARVPAAIALVTVVMALFISFYFISRRNVDAPSHTVSTISRVSSKKNDAPNPQAPIAQRQEGHVVAGSSASVLPDGLPGGAIAGNLRQSGQHLRARSRARRTTDSMTTNRPSIPGEESYIAAIASLDRALKSAAGSRQNSQQNRLILDSYEQSVGVVNRAIVDSQALVSQSPRDAASVDFLQAAYRSKLELMTTLVAQLEPSEY